MTITDHGLLLESRFRRTLLEWDDFGGYYLGEDLVLLRSERWRSDLPFDRDDLDHRAVDIVDQYLLRSESPAVPAGGLERGHDGGLEPAES